MRLIVCLLLAALPLTAAPKDAPSRAADKSCKWEKLSDANLGLEAWVERCDYGFRKIDFLVKDKSLVQRYSDGGAPEPVIDVLDLQAGETPEAGLKRIFAARTKKNIAARCVLAPYKDDSPRPGAKRFSTSKSSPRVAPRKSSSSASARTSRSSTNKPCGCCRRNTEVLSSSLIAPALN